MKKWKKTIVLVLVSVMFLLAALGSGAEKKHENAATEAPTVKTESGEKATLPNVDLSGILDGKKTEYVLKDEVIIDNDKCKFTIKSVEEDSIFGTKFNCEIENKTPDKNLMFAVDDVYVNSYYESVLFAKTVAPGKKAMEDFSVSKDLFKATGLTAVEELDMLIRIYNADDFMEDKIIDGNYVVYPTGLKAGDIVIPDRRTEKTELVIVDNDVCTFIIYGENNDSWMGYSLECYIENKTADAKLMFAWDNVSVNGYMIDPLWARSLEAGKRAYTTISFFKTQFENNGIETVENIEFEVRVYDYNRWDKEYVDEVHELVKR